VINYYDFIDKNEKDKESAVRFNWSAPLVMSPHNPNHIFVAGNHVYKSIDKGQSWEIISPDLSTNHSEKRIQGKSGGITPDNTGAETHCAITSIALSEISSSLIWAITDDGNIQITLDGGEQWNNVRSNLIGVPRELWASRIVASKFEQGTAYVCFDGHRSDDFGTYIYKTADFGKTWQKITNGFTEGETVRVIREDVMNPNLLFAGTETGVWFTVDRGQNWSRLKMNMPTVSVYDIKIHPRENDLIIGSHGRSLWVLDDISPLQQLNDVSSTNSIHLFDQKQATLWENKSRGGQRGHFWFAGDNPKYIENTSSIPRAGFKNNVAITYAVPREIKDSLLLQITNSKGTLERVIKVNGARGIHRYYWDREFFAPNFTSEELEELEIILKAIVVEIGNSRVKRIYKKFKTLKDSDAIRRLIEPLTKGYLNYEFDDKFLIPKAVEGSYRLKLMDKNTHALSTINIRKDPISND